jgi:hypothetical protein
MAELGALGPGVSLAARLAPNAADEVLGTHTSDLHWHFRTRMLPAKMR